MVHEQVRGQVGSISKPTQYCRQAGSDPYEVGILILEDIEQMDQSLYLRSKVCVDHLLIGPFQSFKIPRLHITGGMNDSVYSSKSSFDLVNPLSNLFLVGQVDCIIGYLSGQRLQLLQ